MHHFASIDAKEQVRQATDLVDLVGGYLPLRRQGRNFVGLCPWHDDSKPSLQVNPERQSFKCWVCDIGGDVFSFIMKQENLEFREALEFLADRAGVTLTPLRQLAVGDSGDGARSPTDKKTLFAAASWAEALFHRYYLDSPNAEIARAYCAERQISPESIERFHIGYAPPEWDWLFQQANAAGFVPRTLEAIGLVRERPNGGGYYDFFRGRVMFPIRDTRDRAIAFGGRVLPVLLANKRLIESGVINDAKYINSPETPLFSKSNQLYGLDIAREFIPRPGKPDSAAIVMEGYTDCVMAHQHGVGNAVAVLGTALTERHIPLLRRYADQILLVLDGDEAGKQRASDVLEIFVAESVNLRILTLPRDLDPCDFIASQGGDAFRELLGEAVDALEHKIQTVTKGMVATSNTHDANIAVEEILGTLARAPRLAHGVSSDALLREQQVLARLARQFHVDESLLRSRLSSLRSSIRQRPRPNRSNDSAQLANQPRLNLAPWDQEFFELVFLSSDACRELMHVVGVDDLRSDAGRDLLIACLDMFEEGVLPSFDTLMLRTEDARIKNLLVDLDERSRQKQGSDLDLRLKDLLSGRDSLRKKAHDQQRLEILKSGQLDEQSEEEVLTQFFSDLQRRQSGSEPTDG